MSSRTRFTALWLLLPVLAAGCYRYSPVEAPERGMEVRAQLGTEAAVRRSQGLNDPILHYDGVIVDVAPDAFSIDVLIARSSSAFRDVTIRDTIRLETGEVQSLMRRSISPGRTALFVVGAGAAAFAIVKGIDSVVGGTDEPPGNGEPNVVLVPVFSWAGFRLVPDILRIARE
jgi:hypothetical protein